MNPLIKKTVTNIAKHVKLTSEDNNQDGKIFYKEIDIWDVILNVL